jgi:hypothetical protein
MGKLGPDVVGSFRFVSYATPSTEHSAHKLHRLTNNTVYSHLYFESARM